MEGGKDWAARVHKRGYIGVVYNTTRLGLNGRGSENRRPMPGGPSAGPVGTMYKHVR